MEIIKGILGGVGIALFLVAAVLLSECSPAAQAKFNKDPIGAIAHGVTACSGVALATARDIARTVDQGGTNWFTDFADAVDGLADASCVLEQLGVGQPGAELAPGVLERRRIARVYAARRVRR